MQAVTSWLDALAAAGASMQDGTISGFGDAAAERAAAAAGETIVCPLPHLTCLRFSGADAIDFLHGQITADLKGLPVGGATPGAYCTPKGRMLASFMLVRDADDILLLTDAATAPALQKRLQMFVMRSRVKVTHDTSALIGLAGRGAATVLAAAEAGPAPAQGSTVRSPAGDLWIGMTPGRYLGVLEPSRAIALWPTLAAAARPVGPDCWRWLDIRAGFPWIGQGTQDELVPQMANMDLLGGVSFTKGCYPGQEIVARTHHLGKVKRRMYFAHADVDAVPAPGTTIHADDLGGQAGGIIVTATLSPAGGVDMLAVMHESTAAGSVAHLGAPDGPVLAVRALSYAA